MLLLLFLISVVSRFFFATIKFPLIEFKLISNKNRKVYLHIKTLNTLNKGW